MRILDVPFVRRIRQNHALEHATIHMLSHEGYRPRLFARSDWNGFVIAGNLETETVIAATQEALDLLQRGESGLAVHPRCGTNLATGGILAGSAAVFALSGRCRSPWDKFWRATLATLAALILARPVGLAVQERITTSPDLRDVRAADIRRFERNRTLVHKVRVRRD